LDWFDRGLTLKVLIDVEQDKNGKKYAGICNDVLKLAEYN